MILAVEIRFIDREGVDQVLDFTLRLAAQVGEVVREPAARCCCHPVRNPTLDEIALAFREDHARPAIEKLGQPAKFLLCNLCRFDHGSTLRAEAFTSDADGERKEWIIGKTRGALVQQCQHVGAAGFSQDFDGSGTHVGLSILREHTAE
jgi:hypothetical protein